MKIEITSEFKEEEPGYLLGTMTINGQFHHMEALRVVDVDGMQEVWQPEDKEWNNNHQRMDGIQAYYDGYYLPTEVDGFPGEYVIIITPYAN